MKRLLFFLTVVTLVSCGRSFEKRTAKYAEVGEMSDAFIIQQGKCQTSGSS